MMKVEQEAAMKHYEDEIARLTAQVQELNMEKMRLMRDDQKRMDKIQHELRYNAKVLANAEIDLVKQAFNTKVRASTQVIA